MSVDISVSITEDVVDIIATPTVNIVNVTNSASIDPGLYDLSEFTNTSPNPFVRASGLSSYVPTSRTITINGLTQDLSINRSWTIPATTWGTITGTLSAQTDLQTALNAKQNTLSLTTTGSSGASTLVGATLNVPNYTLSGLGGVPTSRTLTINGVTQDLSSDRTFTISTGITIGSTSITSGTVGRILFEGAGNVVQESSSLFWDATNNRLGIGTSTPTNALTLGAAVAASLQSSAATIFTSNENASNVFSQVAASNDPLQRPVFAGLKSRGTLLSPTAVVAGDACTTFLSSAFDGTAGQASAALSFDAESNASSGNAPQLISFITGTSGATRTTKMQVRSNGNVLIGTTTDAGFRLDVNGTARIQNDVLLTTGILATSAGTTRLQSVLNFFSHNRLGSSGTFGWDIRTVGAQNSFWRYNTSSGNTEFGSNFYGVEFYGASTLRTTMTAGGNWLINTTTDAGFRLDVNGTARVSGAATLAGTNTLSGTTNVSGLSSNWICQYPSNATVKPLSFSAQSGGATSNNVAIQFGFNFRESGGLFTQDIFQNILYDNTTNNVVTGFEWYTHQTQAGSNPSVLAMALRGKTLSIGTNTPNASAVLQADSTTQGFLPPRMTTTQKNAIATPAAGLVVYDTTLNKLCVYTTAWETVTSL